MPTRALLLKDPWASLVVSGKKTVEVRKMKTRKINEEICIAKVGTKTLIGKATITLCKQLSPQEFLELAPKHYALDYYSPPSNSKQKIYGWFLENAVEFDTPIPYKHPPGAQIWVKIPHSLSL